MGRNIGEDRIESILRIRQTSILDFGEYACRADNEIGADYVSVLLEPGSGFNILEYLPYIGSGVAGVLLVLLVILAVYCCRRGRGRQEGRQLTYAEEVIALNNGKQQQLGRELFNKNINEESYRSHLSPDLLDNVSVSGSLRDRQRPLSNLPAGYAGYYGNHHLNSRLEEDRLDSRSSSHSTLPPDSWSRPPPSARRSQSPFNSEAIDYSTNSTMSSVLSRGSRSSRCV